MAELRGQLGRRVGRWSNLTGFLHYWWEEGTVAIIAVGVLLSLRLGKSSIPWLVTILASPVVSNRLFYPEVPDYHGYLAPLYWCSLLGFAAGITFMAARWQGLLFVAALLMSSLAPSRSIEQRDLTGQVLPYELVSDILKTALPNAVVMLSSDHLVFPLMYLQMKGARPDLIIFNAGFANRWYWRYLRAQHPALKISTQGARCIEMIGFEHFSGQEGPSISSPR